MDIPELAYNDAGLIPCIVQDADTREVLMMAWMNAESLVLTLERGETVFWSRSRQELWHKGATSGNTQKVVEIRYDCDADTLLARFSNEQGGIFNGIGLVYNIDEKPLCTGAEKRLEWNKKAPLGQWRSTAGRETAASTVYWGLCRVGDAKRDVGLYGTTATISFWVD